jgi:PAS domain S-box-containing protein
MIFRPKILIVDHKVENLVLIERILKSFDSNIFRCTTGAEALQMTQFHAFALALISLDLPGMDGFETVKRIRENKGSKLVPVIFLSENSIPDEMIVRYLQSGAVDFIRKPVNPEILKGKIRIFLELDLQKHKLEKEIGERKKVQGSLEQSHNLITGFFQSIPDLVFYKSSELKFIGCNKVFEEYTGLTQEKILGRPDEEVLPEEVWQPLRKAEMNVIDQKTVQETELWMHLPDNRKSLMNFRLSPLLNSQDQVNGIIGVGRDVTENHYDKEALQSAKDAADSANLAKSMFLAHMSHEIRTPMNGIIGMTELLMQTELNQEQREFLQVMKLSGDNLLKIINDILDFSKIEAGRIVLESIDFNLEEKLDEVIKLLDFQANKKGLYLKTQISQEVPDILNGDPLRTKQVLINLINNAIKFTETGGITIEVEVIESDEHSIKLLFRVSDTGIGINPEGKEKLFQAFSQTDPSTTRKFGGTGLGLTISKRLVELMNGEIGVDSEYGKGSSFWFTSVFKTGETNRPTEEQLPQATITSPPRHLSILLAEDNPINQRVALFNLTKLGHKVDIAENGQVAVEMATCKQYHLILMDIQMPVKNGLDAAREIREYEIKIKETNPVPIIAMTANAVKGDMESFLQGGMNGYISKPFKSVDLEQVLTHART